MHDDVATPEDEAVHQRYFAAQNRRQVTAGRLAPDVHSGRIGPGQKSSAFGVALGEKDVAAARRDRSLARMSPERLSAGEIQSGELVAIKDDDDLSAGIGELAAEVVAWHLGIPGKLAGIRIECSDVMVVDGDEDESLGPSGIPGQLPLSRGALERGAVADGSVASSGNDLLGTQAGPVLNPIQISVRISHSGEKELRPGRRGVAPHRRRELIASRRMDKLHATQSNRID